MTLEKFDILEEKVKQLSEKFAKLRSEKDSTANSFQELEQKISDLEKRNRALEQEREQMRKRLDKVIANLESVSLNI